VPQNWHRRPVDAGRPGRATAPVLPTVDPTNSAAVKLYQNFGFNIRERIDGYYRPRGPVDHGPPWAEVDRRRQIDEPLSADPRIFDLIRAVPS